MLILPSELRLLSQSLMIVLIKKDEQVLLVHARNFKGNFDSLVAGFVETGENPGS